MGSVATKIRAFQFADLGYENLGSEAASNAIVLRTTFLWRTAMFKWVVVLSACVSWSLAYAGPKEDAYQAIESWAAAFNSNDVEKTVAVYATDALVLGTVSPGLSSSPDELRAYFKGPAASKSQVKLGESSATIVSPEAVAFAGFYEFSRPVKDDVPPAVSPARYSFVVVKRDSVWKILHHHSSLRPKPQQ